MPYLRTCTELTDEVADLFGIYECPRACQEQHTEQGHPEECWCRQCFTLWLSEAMREAVANEQYLAEKAVIVH